jgi:hypothetical protein
MYILFSFKADIVTLGCVVVTVHNCESISSAVNFVFFVNKNVELLARVIT